MGESLDVPAEAIPVKRFDRIHDPRVKIPAELSINGGLFM